VRSTSLSSPICCAGCVAVPLNAPRLPLGEVAIERAVQPKLPAPRCEAINRLGEGDVIHLFAGPFAREEHGGDVALVVAPAPFEVRCDHASKDGRRSRCCSQPADKPERGQGRFRGVVAFVYGPPHQRKRVREFLSKDDD